MLNSLVLSKFGIFSLKLRRFAKNTIFDEIKNLIGHYMGNFIQNIPKIDSDIMCLRVITQIYLKLIKLNIIIYYLIY